MRQGQARCPGLTGIERRASQHGPVRVCLQGQLISASNRGSRIDDPWHCG